MLRSPWSCVYFLRIVVLMFAMVFPLFTAFIPDNAAASEIDLTDMSLEALMDLTVTSVSRRPQKLANAAAAVFVITQDDIRRSGVTTLVEALRMAPGVQVARIDANKWAVSIRGLNGRFANKLLVLMDGRCLYNPLFSGVYWELQDTILEDIDRIEVIRGPSAALWGANAVNGVINITTKSAHETIGGLVSAGGGNEERGFGTARYGMKVGESSSIRFFARHADRNAGEDVVGKEANDAWRITHGGFRFDSYLSARDSLTLQGDYYDARLGETFTLYRLPTTSDPSFSSTTNTSSLASGGNLLSRWERKLSESSTLSSQVYYDHNERDMIVLGETRDIVAMELQYRFPLGERQDVVWGAEYRYNHDRLGNTPYIIFPQSAETTNHFSSFVHDEISLLPDRLALIVGSRFEHNSYTGFEVEPNGRFLWTPTQHTSFWGAVSRAVRTPSRGDTGIQYRFRTLQPGEPPNTSPLPLRLEIDGTKSFLSEDLIAYELGYRTEISSNLTLDLAAFYNVYHHLRVRADGVTFTEPAGTSPTNGVQSFLLSNDMKGEAHGVEAAVEWMPVAWWRLQSSYSYLRLKMHLTGSSVDEINKRDAESDSPVHQFSIRSGFTPWRKVEIDFWLRGVDRVDFIDGESIPAYVTADARIAWKPVKNMEISFVGQNLLHRRHREFAPEFINTLPTQVERSCYGKVTWWF